MIREPHRLLAGPFPALEEALLRRLAVREDPVSTLRVLTPSNALARHLERTYVRREKALLGVRFLTFLDLARESLRRAGREPPPLLGRGEGRILLRRILEEFSEDSWRLRADRLPFLDRCLAALTDLREVPPDAALPSEVHRRRPELVRLLGEYEKELERRNRVDGPGLLRQAAAAAAAPAGGGPPDPPPLAVYGFYDLTPTQRALLEALQSRLPCTVYFPRPGGGANEYAQPLLDWFCGTLEVEPKDLEPRAPGPTDALADRLFTLASEPRPELEEALHLTSAAGARREAEEAARSLLEARHQGIPFDRMAVLLRDGAEGVEELRRALESHAVPCRIALSVPLPGEPLIGGVTGLVQCIAEGFPWSAVCRLLVSPWLTLTRQDPDLDAVVWPALVREAGIVGGGPDPARLWSEGLRRLQRRQEPADDVRPDSPPPGRNQVDELRRTFRELLDRVHGIPERGPFPEVAAALAACIRGLIAPPDPESEPRAAAAWATLEGILEESLSGGPPEGTATRVEAALDLGVRIDAATFHPPSPEGAWGGDGVQVLDLMEGRGIGFDHVVLPGMHEGGFPRTAGPDPLLPDDLRSALDLRPSTDRPAEERLLFSLALRAGRRRVTLVRQRSEESGRPRVASVFQREALRALHGDAVLDPEGLERVLRRSGRMREAPVSPLRPFGDAIPDSEPPDRARMEEARLSAPEAVRLGTLHAAFRPGSTAGHSALDRDEVRRALEAEAARKQPHLGAWDGLVPAGEARPPSSEPLSPTRFEDYGCCPFRYFARHVLDLESLPGHAAYEDVSPLERGSLTHEVLEDLYRELMDQDRFPLRPSSMESARQRARELADQAVANRRARGSPLPPLLWERERHLLHRNLEGVLAWDLDHPGWTPSHLEASFGLEPKGSDPLSTAEPLLLGLPGGGEVRFRGRIDRLDVQAPTDGEEGGNGVALRVVDYKTGGSPSKPRKVRVHQEDKYQLPLYARAVGDLLFPEPHAHVQALYLHLRDGQVWARRLKEGFDQARLLTTIEAYTDGMEQGLFFPRPNDACRYCDFAGICRREPVWRTENRNERDHRTLPYRRAKGIATDPTPTKKD